MSTPVSCKQENCCREAPKSRFGKANTRLKKRVLRVVWCCIILALSAFSLKAITLVWDANTDPDLAGYTVYSGTNSRVYTKSNYVGNVTTNTPAGLLSGVAYYFAITAKNTAGLESPFSNEISVQEPVSLGQPVQATAQLVAGRFRLSWASTLSSTYRVYYKTKLTDSTWTQLTSDLLAAAGTTTSWIDPTLGSAPSRFYRVFKIQ